MPLLEGQHAIITGGGRGIGRAIAAALSAEGAAVTVMGRTEAPLADAVAQGHAQHYFAADATDQRALHDGLQKAAAALGPIDILVANAGNADSAPFAGTNADMFRRMFELNTMSVVHAAHEVLGGMVVRGFGRIVAVVSTAGLKGYGYVSAYCASKHATIGLVRSLAVETARTGVTVNAVCPGYSDTDMVRASVARIVKATGRSEESVLSAMLKDMPLGRLIETDEVAAAVVFLCSPAASAITGATLTVAGGEI
jgi:NAD(P)-dependent dehydrogenase (short-subunit alcohol dehydrogenase family)